MDALSLLFKFLREMSLGVLCALAVLALLLMWPVAYVYGRVKAAFARGGDDDSVYCRQPHRSDHAVVD